MTEEQNEVINKMFMRYGSPSRDTEIKVSHYLIHPEDIDEIKRIEHYDESAARTIEKMQKAIEKLKTYRVALCERYNFIATAPKQKVIKLLRERSYSDKKVYYYISEYEKNMINEKETLIKSTKYSGKDRKKAFDDFDEIILRNTDAIAIKDIEKKHWER